jgi:xanthine dehydrogenase accessory factor
MNRWLRDLARLQDDGVACVVVTVISTRGSVPREAGTRMLVTVDEVIGTVGGGHLEFKAIGIARDMLVEGAAASVQRFPLGASLGQCCGGLMNLLFETVPPRAEWPGKLNNALARGERCAMLTGLKLNAGNASPGRLFVAGERVTGTLGSDGIDAAALALIESQQDETAQPVVLSIDSVDCFVETLMPDNFHIVLFGAGHVGRALVKILAELDCTITWIDSRENEFPKDLPENVIAMVSDAPEEDVARAQPRSYFLVMTHSHPLDQLLAEAILRRGDFAYFGLIGSQTKRNLFEKRLAQRGISQESLFAITCPIGQSTGASIQSKEPMAIAVAVAAELIALHEQHVATQGKSPAKNAETQALAGVSGQKWPGSRSSA